MLSSILRRRRIQCGLKVAEVAASIGIERESLSRIEAGKASVRVETLLALASCITLPTEEWIEPWLLEETRLRPLTEVARYLIDHGDFDNAGKVFERIRGLVRFDHRPHNKGEVYHQWGRWAYESGKPARALHWLRLAERAALRSSNMQERTIATYNYALALKKTRFFAESISKFDEVIRNCRLLDDRLRGGYARLLKANILFDSGSYYEALAEYRKASVALHSDVWLFDCRLGEAICIWQTRSLQVALASFLKLEKLAIDTERQAKFHHNMGVVSRHLSLLSDAIRYLSLAVEIPRTDLSDMAATLAELCLCQTIEGHQEAARQTLQRFCNLEGQGKPYDIAAMTALAAVLGEAAPSGRLSFHGGQNSYEERLSAALSLLREKLGSVTSRQ